MFSLYHYKKIASRFTSSFYPKSDRLLASLRAPGRGVFHTTMTAIISRPINHPSAWSPADFPSKDLFSFDLTPAHIDAFDKAIATLKRLGADDYDGIECHGFDLSSIADDVQRWYRELAEGRGILNLRGFPVGERSANEIALMYYGLGLQWGKLVPQSVLGDRMGHMFPVDELLHGERKRSYQGNHEMRLHSDFCDILGMLCSRPSARGGESRYTSGVSVHNNILATRPELLQALYRGVYFWRLGQWPEEPVTPYRVPIFSERHGKLSVHYAGDWNFIKPENTGVELSDLELEAIDYFVKVSESPELRYDFRIEAGECFLSNNLLHMHARSAFEKESDPKQKRHMLRVWVDCEPSFRPAVPEVRVFGHGLGVPARPELVHPSGRSYLEGWPGPS